MQRIEFPMFIVRESIYSPGLRLPRHSHDYSNVTVIVSGEIEEAGDGGEYRGRSFSVVLKPAGSEHENRVSGAGVRTLTVEIRENSAIAEEIRQRRWSWFEEPVIVRAAVALHRSVKSAIDVEARALDLLAIVLSKPDVASPQPRWVREAKVMLDQRFDEPLRFDAIAHELGLHPVYLSRAFHRHVGVSMHEYLRALRLRHARHLLSASKRTVAGIAAESGFTDSSHLCRTFSGFLGVSPKVYRRLCREV
jgi:AraC family transcriptional regulator